MGVGLNSPDASRKVSVFGLQLVTGGLMSVGAAPAPARACRLRKSRRLERGDEGQNACQPDGERTGLAPRRSSRNLNLPWQEPRQSVLVQT